MAFKSEAQRRKFKQLESLGKISKDLVTAFESATGDTKLPERVKKKPKTAKPPSSKVWIAKVHK